ncbi:hypothetical protein J0695_34215, partial [Streptomyces beijiangensis]|nr:hypothetical protein [Streptomyces beijiangensis]
MASTVEKIKVWFRFVPREGWFPLPLSDSHPTPRPDALPGPPDPEWDRAIQAYQRAYERADRAEKTGLRGARLEALWATVSTTQDAYMQMVPDDPYRNEQIEMRAVFAALCHVATAAESSPCAEPAAHILTGLFYISAADAIRSG